MNRQQRRALAHAPLPTMEVNWYEADDKSHYRLHIKLGLTEFTTCLDPESFANITAAQARLIGFELKPIARIIVPGQEAHDA